jgi:hypothetical protein
MRKPQNMRVPKQQINIIFTIYNKEQCLPNTLISIGKQEINIPIKLFILDDGSKPSINKDKLLSILNTFNLQFDYTHRSHKGPFQSRLDCINQILTERCSYPDDIVIFQSVDVMYSSSLTLSNLISNLSLNSIHMAEVANAIVDPLMYKQYDKFSKTTLTEWDTKYTKHYQGRNRHDRFYPFLTAIQLKDLDKLEYTKNYCDVLTDYYIRKNQFTVKYILSAKAIHQAHKPIPGARNCYIKECPDKCHRQLGNKFKKPNHRIEPNLTTKIEFI